MKKVRVISLMVGMIYLAIVVCAGQETTNENDLIFNPNIRQTVKEAISQSRESIDLEVFLLSDRGIIKELCQAADKGVVVRVILCPTQKLNRKAAEKLEQADCLVKWYAITKKNQIMHLKAAIFDKKRLLFGSSNWTYWGHTLHHEGMLDIRQLSIIKKMLNQFELDWQQATLQPRLLG